MENNNADTDGIDTEKMFEQYQRRYFNTHINSMIELCYPSLVTNNQRLTDSDVPLFINCINRLNRAVGYMQEVSDKLQSEEQE